MTIDSKEIMISVAILVFAALTFYMWQYEIHCFVHGIIDQTESHIGE